MRLTSATEGSRKSENASTGRYSIRRRYIDKMYYATVLGLQTGKMQSEWSQLI
jgi:hypothetical protein